MKLTKYIDLLIPRGGQNLIRSVVQKRKSDRHRNWRGNCHMYVDADADLDMAVRHRGQREDFAPVGVHALETVLVHKSVAEAFLPAMRAALDAHHVELRGCEITQKILPGVWPRPKRTITPN
jgi:glutamate-5-semialdehyde dehydrogenase